MCGSDPTIHIYQSEHDQGEYFYVTQNARKVCQDRASVAASPGLKRDDKGAGRQLVPTVHQDAQQACHSEGIGRVGGGYLSADSGGSAGQPVTARHLDQRASERCKARSVVSCVTTPSSRLPDAPDLQDMLTRRRNRPVRCRRAYTQLLLILPKSRFATCGLPLRDSPGGAEYASTMWVDQSPSRHLEILHRLPPNQKRERLQASQVWLQEVEGGVHQHL